MRAQATETIYTAGQFMEVLQAMLYQHDEFNEQLIPQTTSYTPDDTLLVSIPNGQVFTLTAHVTLDVPVVASRTRRVPRRKRS